MLHGFFGGVRPERRKKATAGLQTTLPAAPPAQVLLPVTEALVAVGDHVDVGTRLCNPRGRHAAVHATVSGTVTAIEPRRMPSGSESLCVVIGNDTLDTPAPVGIRANAEKPPSALKPKDIVAAIARGGVCGMGGACFPTDQKLAVGEHKVDTLILNGCECESYLTADRRLLLERTADVLSGARLLARVLQPRRIIVAVEGDQYDGATALRGLLPLRGGDVEVKVLRARYPQGAEKQLIQRLTGRKVPPAGLPRDVGCAVFNVATAAAVYDAVYEGKPLTHRVVTVTGRVRKPRNLLVPIGVSVDYLVNECGGFDGRPERVLMGGGMMGLAQADLSAPISPGTAAVVALGQKELKPLSGGEGSCIRCGRCTEVCPMGLTPAYLRLYAKAGNVERLEKLHISDCMECGACAYICPARLGLVADIREGKELMKRG